MDSLTTLHNESTCSNNLKQAGGDAPDVKESMQGWMNNLMRSMTLIMVKNKKCLKILLV